MIGPCRRALRPIRWLGHNFVKGTGCFLCWLNISVQMRFGMPGGSRVGGFPVMEPAEQSMTGRPRGWGWGLWDRDVEWGSKAEVMDIKWSGDTEKHSCMEVALALTNRPGLSYGSDISSRARAPAGLMCLINQNRNKRATVLSGHGPSSLTLTCPSGFELWRPLKSFERSSETKEDSCQNQTAVFCLQTDPITSPAQGLCDWGKSAPWSTPNAITAKQWALVAKQPGTLRPPPPRPLRLTHSGPSVPPRAPVSPSQGP